MLGKLKDLTQKSYFHVIMISSIIIMLLFVFGVIILKYNVEGEKNMPFKLEKISIISSSEGKDAESTETRWAFDVYQSNDIYLYIGKNDNYKELDAIQSVQINNIEIEGKRKDNIKIYKPDLDEEKLLFKNKEENQVESIEYLGAMESNLKQLTISNQGGLIAFRCSNDNIVQYTSNEEEINHLELLKKAGVQQEDLNVKIIFDLIIKLEKGKQYKSTIEINLPVENVIEQGTASKEITNSENFIFKRVKIHD